jgi:hypothetical protein
MSPSELLSQVTDPNVIRDHFDWHVKQGLAVVLMMASGDGDSYVRARLTGFDSDDMTAVCTGVRGVVKGQSLAYTLIGTTAKGANFLASGTMQPYSGTVDCFKLSFPEALDISQSRDSYRCPAPTSHFLHFKPTDAHLSNVVCKVQNLSLGGLAVEWNINGNPSVPLPGTIAQNVTLVTSDDSILLGNLCIAHATRRKNHVVLGMKFERDVPRQYGSLVLNAQRFNYLA